LGAAPIGNLMTAMSLVLFSVTVATPAEANWYSAAIPDRYC
jgi:hypothetical protein